MAGDAVPGLHDNIHTVDILFMYVKPGHKRLSHAVCLRFATSVYGPVPTPEISKWPSVSDDVAGMIELGLQTPGIARTLAPDAGLPVMES